MLKRLWVAFSFCQLLLSFQLNADDASYWDETLVSSYVHHSELQRRWAWSFLAQHLKDLKGDEQVLDVGCGDGKITADLSKFVPYGFVVGIDISNPMISWARRQYHPLDYFNLAFLEGGFLSLPEDGPYDLILSCCAFQHCSNQKQALIELSHQLTPEGKLLILVPAPPSLTNPAWNQARINIQNSPKWSSYWENYLPRKFPSIEQFRELLESTGFDPVKIEMVPTMDPFNNIQELLYWMEGTFTPIVPQEMRREFYLEWIQEYLRIDPEAFSANGVVFARLGYITIEARIKQNKSLFER